MSILEITVLVGALVLAAARWAPARWRRPITLVAGVEVALCVALLVSGTRWQLVPALVAVAVELVAIARWSRRAGRAPARRRRVAAGTAAVLGMIAASPAAAWAFPVPAFPPLAGGHTVGTTVIQWTDTARPETATSEPDHRIVVAQLWYPAARGAPADAGRAQYLGRDRREASIVVRALADSFGVPAFLLDGVVRARSHAVPDAPVAGGPGRLPVVVFSPGLGGVRGQNTALMEDLASRGYVAVALDHPYDSAAVVLDDGRTVRSRLAAVGDPVEADRLRAAWTAVRAADLSFALTRLGELDRGRPGAPFTGRLDLTRVAAVGHSLGGAAALQALRQDPRFSAAVDLDGAPEILTTPFHRPVLILADRAELRQNAEYAARVAQVLDLTTEPGYRLAVPGTAHLTFTDAPLYLPPVPALVGSRPRAAGPVVTAAATAAFLDAALAGRPQDAGTALARYGTLRGNTPAGIAAGRSTDPSAGPSTDRRAETRAGPVTGRPRRSGNG